MTSVGYIARPCFKQINKQNNNNKKGQAITYDQSFQDLDSNATHKKLSSNHGSTLVE
jgi:hypothetical protein